MAPIEKSNAAPTQTRCDCGARPYYEGAKLAWINSEREDEPRWGDRHSVQTDEMGTPLYVIHCQNRGTIARWWVGDFLEWFKQDCWTLKEAKAFAQHDYQASCPILGVRVDEH